VAAEARVFMLELEEAMNRRKFMGWESRVGLMTRTDERVRGVGQQHVAALLERLQALVSVSPTFFRIQ
jgi:hypothetical protein